MNKRQQKKATKKAWHPLTMRVKLRNGKIRNRTWKLGCYLRYAKITYPPIDMHLVKMNMASVPPLCAGHLVEIEAYRNAQISTFEYTNGNHNRHLFGGLL